MKKLFFLLSISFLILSSCSKVKPIGEAPLNLQNFSFSTSISDLLPSKYKHKSFDGYYGLQGYSETRLMKVDTIYNEYSDNRKAIGIQYSQTEWSPEKDNMAMFGSQKFQRISFSTSMDGKIEVVCAVADYLTKDQSDNLLKTLIKAYGNPQKLVSNWLSHNPIYEWNTKDRTIRLTISGENKDFECYLFLINPLYKKEILDQKSRQGDFCSID